MKFWRNDPTRGGNKTHRKKGEAGALHGGLVKIPSGCQESTITTPRKRKLRAPRLGGGKGKGRAEWGSTRRIREKKI